MTAPSACPYLPDRIERKVFTELEGMEAPAHLEALGHAGFRRSQNVAYRPNCEHCNACVSVRVCAQDFVPSQSQRRLLKHNQDIHVYACDPWTTEEQYALLRQYLDSRHPYGGMASMDQFDYADMVERSPVDTVVYEYRLPPAEPDQLGLLIGVCLTDHLSDGVSMVYSFYHPQSVRKGIGTYIILDHILRARALGQSHVYLGYWVQGSTKMDYKARFRPLERLDPTGWVRMPDHPEGEGTAEPNRHATG